MWCSTDKINGYRHFTELAAYWFKFFMLPSGLWLDAIKKKKKKLKAQDQASPSQTFSYALELALKFCSIYTCKDRSSALTRSACVSKEKRWWCFTSTHTEGSILVNGVLGTQRKASSISAWGPRQINCRFQFRVHSLVDGASKLLSVIAGEKKRRRWLQN